MTTGRSFSYKSLYFLSIDIGDSLIQLENGLSAVGTAGATAASSHNATAACAHAAAATATYATTNAAANCC